MIWISQVIIPLKGRGGRTVQKFCHHDLSTVGRLSTDILILEMGTNKLAIDRPEVVGSQVEDLVLDQIGKFSVRVVIVCKIIPCKYHETNFNKKVHFYNRYIDVVIGNIRGALVWSNRWLIDPKNEVLQSDCVHLNEIGQYKLY